MRRAFAGGRTPQSRRMIRRLLSWPSAVACIGLVWMAGPARADEAALQPCRLSGVKHEILCGRLQRPLDPGKPDGRTIEIHYAVVPATARSKLPDPVLLLAGGPGQSAITLAGQVLPLLGRLGNRRDLVFIDQRGTGRSAPLECESDDALPFAERLDTARAIARLRDCRARLQTLPHGDLRHYTTPIAMADVDAVRAALDAPRVNLVGASYGTRAALDYLRQFPDRVRRVVLDGIAPPDMVLPASMGADVQAAFETLLADCERSPQCRARHPRLRERWQALIASLPRAFEAADPANGRPVTLQLTRDTLAAAVRGPLYAPALSAALPFAIEEALAGRGTPLLGLAGSLGGGARRLRIAEGMHFSVVCAEDWPRMAAASEPSAAAPADDFGAAYARPYAELCPDWPRAELPAAFYRIAPSPVPVLALSGTLDPATPPRHGERVVAALGAKARHVVVPNAGHGVLASVGCARELLHRFIDADDDAAALAVDASCLAKLPRPPAFEPPRADALLPAGAAR